MHNASNPCFDAGHFVHCAHEHKLPNLIMIFLGMRMLAVEENRSA